MPDVPHRDFAQFGPQVQPHSMDRPVQDAMTGMMPGQPLMPNQLATDASAMVPILMANGNAPAQMARDNFSAGESRTQVLPQSSLLGLLAGHQLPGSLESHSSRVLSSDEIALYDRQIRLWGMAAQAKIRNANVLLITLRALANEVAKNLVLAGIGSLTILDDALVTEADLGAQFFLSEESVGQNRGKAALAAIQQLNPRVAIHVDAQGVKSKGPSYFSAFDVVIATDLDPDSYNLINTATRLNRRPFYAAGTHGMYGFIFSDLIEHDFVIEREQGNVPTTPGKVETRTRSIIDVKTRKEGSKVIESVTKRELYSTWFLASDVAGLPEEYTKAKSKRRLRGVSPALSCLRALWDFMQIQGGRLPGNRDDLKLFTQIATRKHKSLGLPSETLRPEFLRSFLQNLGSEIAPVAAILGGQLAQDVINVLGHTQQPIQNTVIFDGTSMESLVHALHPEGALGANLLSMAPPENSGNVSGMMPMSMGPMPAGLAPMSDVPPQGSMPAAFSAQPAAAIGAMQTGAAPIMPRETSNETTPAPAAGHPIALGSEQLAGPGPAGAAVAAGVEDLGKPGQEILQEGSGS